MQPSPGPAFATPEPEVTDSVMADGDDEGWISVSKDKDKGRRSSSSPLRSSRRTERVTPSPVGRGGILSAPSPVGRGGGIQKDNQVKPKTPTRRPSSGDLKLSSVKPQGAELPPGLTEGLRLTRSKSERDRLMQLSAQLAQGVESASAEAMGRAPSPPALTHPSPWGNLNGAAGLPPGLPPGQPAGLPLKRSAASELALTLGDIGMDQ